MVSKPLRPGHAALRKGRCSLAGQVYFLTFVTHGRQPLFAEWLPAATMSRLLSREERWRGGELLAWVLMPDHWHGLLRLDGERTLGDVLRYAKGGSAHAFNRARQCVGAVWAPGCFERALRREENLRAAARYLVANPLRAGLVADIGDYPFWDAIWLTDDCPV